MVDNIRFVDNTPGVAIPEPGTLAGGLVGAGLAACAQGGAVAASEQSAPVLREDGMLQQAGGRRPGNTSGSRLERGLLAGLVALVAAGCSGGSPYDLVQVAGTVKYEDGSLIPAETIMLKFEPQAKPLDAKTHPRKAYGRVNVADGTFDTVTTHKYGDGVVAGRHKVLVIPTTADGKITKLIPDEYRNPGTTPVEVDTDHQPMEIRVKKPSGST